MVSVVERQAAEVAEDTAAAEAAGMIAAEVG
jgi:hypothetical protein